MRYINKETKKEATLIEENKRFKTVMLEYEDGQTTIMTTSTLKRLWKEVKEPEPTITADEYFIRQKKDDTFKTKYIRYPKRRSKRLKSDCVDDIVKFVCEYTEQIGGAVRKTREDAEYCSLIKSPDDRTFCHVVWGKGYVKLQFRNYKVQEIQRPDTINKNYNYHYSYKFIDLSDETIQVIKKLLDCAIENDNRKYFKKTIGRRELMGRFRADEAEHYGGQGGTGYFSLKNDKDVATVRFMYNSMDDVEGYAVHQVEVGDKKRYVNCLRNYNDPIDNCPFCRAKKFQTARLFIPLYNIDQDKVQVWERGKKFFAKISSICARYDNLVSHKFEIERNGRPGETTTTYEIYEVGQDDTTLEDLPELPEIIGSIVLDKSADDMEFYLTNGYFPPDGDEAPVRRRSSRQEEEPPFDEDRRSGSRRTPATSGRRDRF